LFISGANKIYFRDETNKDTYINSPADDQLALYASTVLIAKDTDGDGTGLVVSNLDTNNPPLASTIDMLEIGTVFGTADTYGFRLKYDGDTNNFEVQSGDETTVNTRMVIERDTGNVGIGTDEMSSLSSMADDLVVGSGTGGKGITIFSGSSSTGSLFFADGKTGHEPYDGFIQYLHDDQKMFLGVSDNLTAMVIDSAGNVGIGTAAPGSLYVGAKNLVVGSGTGNNGITVFSATDGQGVIHFADGTSSSAPYDGRIIYHHGSQYMRFSVAGGTSAVTIESDLDVKVDAGNLVIGTAGKGIDFQNQASPAAGMTSELLDRYEEGTWTATLTDGSNNATMSNATGAYTRIGRQVTVTGYFSTSSLGSVSGTIKLSGLPFSIAPSYNQYYNGGSLGYSSGLNITAGQTVTCDGNPNTTDLRLWLWDATTGVTTLQGSEWSADGAITLSASYVTAT
jgi:hypothetical protein